MGGGIKHFHLDRPYFLHNSFIRLSGVRFSLCTVIIPAEPALWVFLTGTPIPDRVIQAAMMVECTSMSAYRLMDQNMDK